MIYALNRVFGSAREKHEQVRKIAVTKSDFVQAGGRLHFKAQMKEEQVISALSGTALHFARDTVPESSVWGYEKQPQKHALKNGT